MELSVWIEQMRAGLDRTQAQLQVVANDGVTDSETGLVMTKLRMKLCRLVAGTLDESEDVFEEMKFVSSYLEPLAGIESKLQQPEKMGSALLLSMLDQLRAAESNGPPIHHHHQHPTQHMEEEDDEGDE